MEIKSPPPCPSTAALTVRRNPPRRARPTPSSAIPLREPLSSPSLAPRDIFNTKLTVENPNNADSSTITTLPENLKVFLRIRPPIIQKTSRPTAESKNAWPKNPKPKSNARPKTKKSSEVCVQLNEDACSVTVSTPQALQEMKRIKSEVYEGFSHVFSAESSQNSVYEEMVKPLVEDFLKGKSGMLAAMGPSGSGKTHTVFGCAREPGMVPLALRRIFSEDKCTSAQISRVVYLSMFEISSERGKGEKMIDLLHDGGDVSMQHSVVKGLQEVAIDNAQQAESLIARGMLKRATAMTNSNSQSSRSQCIINIRCGSKQGGEGVDDIASNTILTIVDLAGAEREKKTGNQGVRLLESNFINNTSMVFGQCLRSLLEHQRNRNKTLQKHYKNSLLTRYLRDYLEGRKRMMLILTVKPGVEDYLDTSFLLRQAAPFAKIKFKTVEEPVNLTNKRPNQALPQAGQLKKMKFGNNETILIDKEKANICFPQNLHKENYGEAIDGFLDQNIQHVSDENTNESHALSNELSGLRIQEKLSRTRNDSKHKVNKDREYKIMQGLSKALWKVLKQYKEKLEGVETENCYLKDSLANEKKINKDLQNELTNGRIRVTDLENEVKELKSQFTCCNIPSSNVLRVSTHGSNFDTSQYQKAETPEVKSDIVSPSSRGLYNTENQKVADPFVTDSGAIFAFCSDGGDVQHPQQLEDLLENHDDTETTEGFRNTSKVDTCLRNEVLSASINISRELVFCEDTGTVDIPSTSEADQQSTSESLYTSCMSDQDVPRIVGDVKNLESQCDSALEGSCFVASLECKSNRNNIQDCENLNAVQELTRFQNGMTAYLHADLKELKSPWNDKCNHVKEESTLEPLGTVLPKEGLDAPNGVPKSSSSKQLAQKQKITITPIRIYEQVKDLSGSSDDTENIMGTTDTSQVETCFRNVALSASMNSPGKLIHCEDMGTVDIPSTGEAVLRSTSSSLGSGHRSEQDVPSNNNITSFVEEENIPMAAHLHADLKSSQSQSNDDTRNQANFVDNDMSFVEEQIASMTAHLHADPKEFESSWNGDTCNHVKEESTLEPLANILLKEGLDSPKVVPKVASSIKALKEKPRLAEKPRRRLQPVSSILLKDLSLLDIKDENDKPKGAGKRATMTEQKSRTQGSLSLLNLLTSKLDR